MSSVLNRRPVVLLRSALLLCIGIALLSNAAFDLPSIPPWGYVGLGVVLFVLGVSSLWTDRTT